MKELYLEDGTKAGLYDVCKWWIETYPADVFKTKPKEMAIIRVAMWRILALREIRKHHPNKEKEEE